MCGTLRLSILHRRGCHSEPITSAADPAADACILWYDRNAQAAVSWSTC